MPAGDVTRKGEALPAYENVLARVAAVGSLDSIALMADIDAEERRRLAARSDWFQLPAGAEITGPDDASGCVFMLVAGRARVVNHTLLGNEVELSVIEPGSYFGELSAFDDGPRSASVVALDDCLVAAMPRDVFFEMISRHPRVLRPVLHNLARMVRSTNDRVMDHALI